MWVSDDVTASKMAKISKSRQNLEGYPRSFFKIGSWLTKTGVKKWFQFNGHRTPDFDPTMQTKFYHEYFDKLGEFYVFVKDKYMLYN